MNPDSLTVGKPFRIKVLMLTWEFPPNVVGGLSKHVFGLSNQLVQLGAEVHVVTAGAEKLLLEEKQKGIFIHRVKPLNEQDENFLSWIGGLNLAMVNKTIQLAAVREFALIHAHDWLVGAAAIVLKEALRLPLLTTIHGTEYGRNGGIYNEMQHFIHEKEQQLMKNSDQVIVCSEYMKKALQAIFRHRGKIAVISNGVDIERGIDTPAKGVFSERHKKMVFSIGRIVKEKGFETIIKAATIVKENDLNIYFVVAGKGPMLESYRQQVLEKKLGNYLAFIGYITDEEKNICLTESEINLFPSLYEPFGIVALESMIHGKPTIVSDTGGFKGIIKHKETGLLMIPGNVDSLLEQITFLLTNPEQAKEIGRKGRRQVMDLYSWRKSATETKRLMEELLIPM